MSRLLLYTDGSPAFLWHFATLHASREVLEQHHIVFAPMMSRMGSNPVANHKQLWLTSQPLHPLQKLLDSGHDVLLFSPNCTLNGNLMLAKRIRQDLDLSRHEVTVVHLFGNELCRVEQNWRSLPVLMPRNTRAESYPRQAKLAERLLREWGKDHVSLLVDASRSPTITLHTPMVKNIFKALGLPAPVLPSSLLPSPRFLRSCEAIRLWHALEVRSNAWPVLDKLAATTILHSLDQGWEGDEVPFSPLSLRKELLRFHVEDMQRLGELLGTDAERLSTPDWLSEQPEMSPETPLAEDRVAAFAAALPEAISVPLRRRYGNDLPLLTGDQMQLRAALSARGGQDTVHVDEPLPPVALTVLTMTYNQENYIAQCMDSVLAQQTRFPVRHLVLDHGSTDGTAAIVADYAARYPSIQPVFCGHIAQENTKGLFLRCRSTYAALCDGDDYFTDPQKLQRQVDFLESHPHCSLCFHPVLMFWEDNSQPPAVFPPTHMLPRGVRTEYYLADLLRANMIQTNSVVYRWRFKDGLPDWFRADICPGDWYWHLLHAEVGKIGFLPTIMAAYRRHKKSLYNLAFIDTVEHRRTHGMTELKTYQAINQHFQGRYFSRLSMLANGVFSDFLSLMLKEGDNSLFDEACHAAPEFAVPFIKEVKVANASR